MTVGLHLLLFAHRNQNHIMGESRDESGSCGVHLHPWVTVQATRRAACSDPLLLSAYERRVHHKWQSRQPLRVVEGALWVVAVGCIPHEGGCGSRRGSVRQRELHLLSPTTLALTPEVQKLPPSIETSKSLSGMPQQAVQLRVGAKEKRCRAAAKDHLDL
jgi:hypothetical protein